MTRLPSTSFRHQPRVEHGPRPRTKFVVIHTIEGTAAGAEGWFGNPGAGGEGAHVIIGRQGAVQLADLDQKCWHAHAVGNDNGVGIEHEGAASYSKFKWLSKDNRKLLRLSANRTAWMCYHYKLGTPKHRSNVLGHVDVPGNDHVDPGKGWPWIFYIMLCRRAYKNLLKSNGKSWGK